MQFSEYRAFVQETTRVGASELEPVWGLEEEQYELLAAICLVKAAVSGTAKRKERGDLIDAIEAKAAEVQGHIDRVKDEVGDVLWYLVRTDESIESWGEVESHEGIAWAFELIGAGREFEEWIQDIAQRNVAKLRARREGK